MTSNDGYLVYDLSRIAPEKRFQVANKIARKHNNVEFSELTERKFHPTRTILISYYTKGDGTKHLGYSKLDAEGLKHLVKIKKVIVIGGEGIGKYL
jgi:hypothetical protein